MRSHPRQLRNCNHHYVREPSRRADTWKYQSLPVAGPNESDPTTITVSGCSNSNLMHGERIPGNTVGGEQELSGRNALDSHPGSTRQGRAGLHEAFTSIPNQDHRVIQGEHLFGTNDTPFWVFFFRWVFIVLRHSSLYYTSRICEVGVVMWLSGVRCKSVSGFVLNESLDTSLLSPPSLSVPAHSSSWYLCWD